jgi:hypothetical protein
METLIATKVLLDQDLRRTHRMRDAGRNIRTGQCWVYVNTARTMFRAVGKSHRPHGGTMISGWAADGEEVDVDLLQKLVGGMRLRLNFTEDQEADINGEERPRRRQAA